MATDTDTKAELGMATDTDTKAELGSKENPITEDVAPPTAAEEGDTNEVVPAVKRNPNARMAAAAIGGIVEMGKFHIQNLINLTNNLMNVNRKIGVGTKNMTPVIYTLTIELHCSTVMKTYMKTVEYATLCRDWISRLIGRPMLIAGGYTRSYTIILMIEPSFFVDLRSTSSRAPESTTAAEHPMQ